MQQQDFQLLPEWCIKQQNLLSILNQDQEKTIQLALISNGLRLKRLVDAKRQRAETISYKRLLGFKSTNLELLRQIVTAEFSQSKKQSLLSCVNSNLDDLEELLSR
ncbi:hypothetical protein LZP69_04580 [Shewanella sp. AS1]|uniref:hypothetical protein n=1 Tax=Shewanella sp. AS1 TaxID=2907626 RepID=UPI001F4487DF|nr:hypothetical protein [Shewanella sp. AS1]MCE9678470.1 hypothetical protein [Shewanella sp. AS1]